MEGRRTTTSADEARWQERWERLGVFEAADDGRAERRYLLTMFPYPSGDLHTGHAEAFAFADVLARYWRLRGYDVLNPIGWDSFGLPAENAALARGESPARFTEENIATQARTTRRYGVSFDWTRRLHTHDPEYYRWTQWLFVRMHAAGLAYRAAAPVNWCPRDATVLANEQVVGGRCERCGAEVTQRELTQWYLRVTDYADRLLDDMAALEDSWPQRVLTMQRHWIGRSEGATVRFGSPGGGPGIEVFTTRPETLPGVTFLAVAPESRTADQWCAPAQREALDAYRSRALAASEVERQSATRDPSGVPLGTSAVHPLTGESVPVWAASYVLGSYGTGAVMGVPALAERDRAFADAHGLPVREVLADAPGAEAVVVGLEEAGAGERATRYRLRDWLVSRQRYWGAPVPVVHCPACGEVPVPDDQLPVELPELAGDELAPRGRSPLAAAHDWVRTGCPRCGGPAERDTDTMDTFVDSSWYFLRFCSPHYTDGPFDPEAVRRWMPVATYVGGVEHAVLHLLYSRFVTKVLHDLGLVDVVEPFAALLNQGQVLHHGKAMSKSLGNGVDLGEQIDLFGADAVRLALVFAGPATDDVDWADVSPPAMQRFTARALRVADDVAAVSDGGAGADDGDPGLRRIVHGTVEEVAGLVDDLRFNVAVARLMELVSATRRAIDSGPGAGDPAVREAAEATAVMLSLFAPYCAEEMWERLGHGPSVAMARWPDVDEELVASETVVAVVQVDGKVRDRVTVPVGVAEAELGALAMASTGARRALAGRGVARVVTRPPLLVNLVPER